MLLLCDVNQGYLVNRAAAAVAATTVVDADIC